MRRTLATAAASLLLASLGACGDGGDTPPPTTVTIAPTTTVTIPQGDAKGIACLNLATEALQLFNDFNAESRGIVAPDEAAYAERADALRAEHAQLGCPGDLLKGFP